MPIIQGMIHIRQQIGYEAAYVLKYLKLDDSQIDNTWPLKLPLRIYTTTHRIHFHTSQRSLRRKSESVFVRCNGHIHSHRIYESCNYIHGNEFPTARSGFAEQGTELALNASQLERSVLKYWSILIRCGSLYTKRWYVNDLVKDEMKIYSQRIIYANTLWTAFSCCNFVLGAR